MGLIFEGVISTGDIIKYAPQANHEIENAFNYRHQHNIISLLEFYLLFSGQDRRTLTIVDAQIAIPQNLGGGILTENVIYQARIANGKTRFTTGKNHWWLSPNQSPGHVVLSSAYNASIATTQK